MLKGTKVVVKSGKSSSKRMGPNKGTHRQHYNTFVTNSITQCSKQMQTNLPFHCTLLNYIPMNEYGRGGIRKGRWIADVFEWRIQQCRNKGTVVDMLATVLANAKLVV